MQGGAMQVLWQELGVHAVDFVLYFENSRKSMSDPIDVRAWVELRVTQISRDVVEDTGGARQLPVNGLQSWCLSCHCCLTCPREACVRARSVALDAGVRRHIAATLTRYPNNIPRHVPSLLPL